MALASELVPMVWGHSPEPVSVCVSAGFGVDEGEQKRSHILQGLAHPDKSVIPALGRVETGGTEAQG